VRELALVLHTHLPWVAGHGRWPVGEEWLHQAWAASWLRVTRVLEEAGAAGMRDVLTLGVTPTVAWQVADPRLAAETAGWLAAAVWRAEEQRHHHRMGSEVTALAPHWWRHFAELAAYHSDVEARGGLLAVWRGLAEAGVIELLAGPATHALLPIEDAALVDAQLATGVAAHRAWAGGASGGALGLWPPELGHAPGLAGRLVAHGVTHVVLDGPCVDAVAGGGDADAAPVRGAVRLGADGPVAFVRDRVLSERIWADPGGYPGDPWYLDHHATGGYGVHRSWRVTDPARPPNAKATYVPARAAARTAAHADDLVAAVRTTLADDPDGVAVLALDTELLGQWWHEGPEWLAQVLARLRAAPDLATTTLARRAAAHPPRRSVPEPTGTWAPDGGMARWTTGAAEPLRHRVDAAIAAARAALAGGRGPDEARAAVGRQVALLMASDWTFMATRGQAAGYAADRVAAHADRLGAVVDALALGDDATARAAAVGGDPVPADAAAFVAALDPDGPEAAARPG
jgi:1,4-alpha-glucan branching enzyme